jgi:hypothetical protein
VIGGHLDWQHLQGNRPLRGELLLKSESILVRPGRPTGLSWLGWPGLPSSLSPNLI